MPRNIEAKKKKGINRKNFLEKQKSKKVNRKPRKKKAPLKPDKALTKDARQAIRYSANNLLQIVITYHKTTTKEVKKYHVCPYSYRYKRLKIGMRKMLFAFDIDAGHIKGYSLKNISKVEITKKTFSPKWPIEIE